MMFLKFRYRLGYETPVPRGRRFDHLAAVLPDPARRAGAAPDHADEADHPLRHRGGGRVQRGAAGQGGRGEAAAHHAGCAPTPRSCPPTWPTRPTPGCWPRRCAGSPRPGGGSRPPAGRPAPGCAIAAGRPGRGRRAIGAKLRLRAAQGRDEAQATVRRITGELAELAERAAADAEKLLVNARRALRRAAARRRRSHGRGRRPDPAAGRRRGPAAPRGRRPDRAARRHPPDRRADPATAVRDHPGRGHPPGQPARPRRPPDRQGPSRPAGGVRLQGPGRRQRRRLVLDHTVERGNPADAPQLAPAVGRVIARTRRRPRTVTADRGYGEARVENDLHDLGVRTVVIPRKGRPGKARKPTNTAARSAGPSSGEPAAKPGSAPSNGSTAGTAPASTASTEPGSGPDTASWPTTWSRSPRWPRDRPPNRRSTSAGRPACDARALGAAVFFRLK